MDFALKIMTSFWSNSEANRTEQNTITTWPCVERTSWSFGFGHQPLQWQWPWFPSHIFIWAHPHGVTWRSWVCLPKSWCRITWRLGPLEVSILETSSHLENSTAQPLHPRNVPMRGSETTQVSRVAGKDSGPCHDEATCPVKNGIPQRFWPSPVYWCIQMAEHKVMLIKTLIQMIHKKISATKKRQPQRTHSNVALQNHPNRKKKIYLYCLRFPYGKWTPMFARQPSKTCWLYCCLQLDWTQNLGWKHLVSINISCIHQRSDIHVILCYVLHYIACCVYSSVLYWSMR